jgi:hypothetical protein
MSDNEAIQEWVIAFRTRLRAMPRYWIQVAKQPMPRSVPCVMWADVERAIDAGLPDPPDDAQQIADEQKAVAS